MNGGERSGEGFTGSPPATVTVLSAGAIRRSVIKVSELFTRETSKRVATDFAPAPKVRDRVLAGEKVDVVIASAGALDKLAAAEKIVPATRAVVGRTGMAVMMRKGAEALDLSDTAAFKRALFAADQIVYNAGSSGAYAATIVDRLGLRAQMGSKIRVVERGADMIEIVAAGRGRVLGLAQLTNVLDQVEKGVAVALAGPFPAEIQNVTSYEIAVVAGSGDSALAGMFVRTFAMAEARKLLTAAGLS